MRELFHVYKWRGKWSMKRYYRAWLVLIIGLCFRCNELISMEEKGSIEIDGTDSMAIDEESILHRLPTELQVYLLPFLGSSVTELIDNINKLSLVDTYFRDLLQANRESMKQYILKKFGLVAIKNHLKKAIVSGDLKVVRLLGIYVLDQTIINESIFSVIEELLRKRSYDGLKILFDRKIITLDNPVNLSWPLLSKILSFAKIDDTDDLEKFKEFLRYLITTKNWNVNMPINFARTETPFSRALILQKVPLVQFLLEQGIDLTDPINRLQLQTTIQALRIKLLDRGLSQEDRAQAQQLLDLLQNYHLVGDLKK